LKIRRSLVARGRHIELPADLERDRHDITRLGGGQAGNVHLHLSADSVAQAQQCHALTAIGQDFVKDGQCVAKRTNRVPKRVQQTAQA